MQLIAYFLDKFDIKFGQFIYFCYLCELNNGFYPINYILTT